MEILTRSARPKHWASMNKLSLGIALLLPTLALSCTDSGHVLGTLGTGGAGGGGAGGAGGHGTGGAPRGTGGAPAGTGGNDAGSGGAAGRVGSGGTGVGGALGSGGSAGGAGGDGAGVGGAGGADTTCSAIPLVACPSGQICDYDTPNRCNAGYEPGHCIVPPGGCITIFAPVCGCDGRTYSSDCDRQVARVQKDHDGACADGGIATDAAVDAADAAGVGPACQEAGTCQADQVCVEVRWIHNDNTQTIYHACRANPSRAAARPAPATSIR
jgi:hypothetical protein